MLELARLRGENFRLFQTLDLKPHPKFNWIVGDNAAGKTSFLEMIYCLGRAKSFRGQSPSELAGRGTRHWALRGSFHQADRPVEEVAVVWAPAGVEIRTGSAVSTRVADLVRAYPVQVIEPTMHRLLQEGPGYRRSFLDWGVFHVEQRFFPIWRRNQRALRQRNRALRSGLGDTEVNSWNAELIETAQQLFELRRQHLDLLQPILARQAPAIFGDAEWSAELYPGWPEEMPYRELLERQLARDRRMGMTVDGAHRAELRLKVQRVQMRNRISRGQQKLMIAALVLAQAELIQQAVQRAPILLVDDFTAELAQGFQDVLLRMLVEHPGQVFATSFEPPQRSAKHGEFAMFHVEHGRIAQW